MSHHPSRAVTASIPAAHTWPTNGDLIDDAWRLLAIADHALVLDTTHGRAGGFWTRRTPPHLVACDRDPGRCPPGGVAADFARQPWPDATFDVVVCDPPYAFRGTASAFDDRYGVDAYMPWTQRMAMMVDALAECARVTRPNGLVLYKCQDQVVSGRVVWQTDRLTAAGAEAGLTKIDRLDLLGTARPQPMTGRRQRHAHGRPSSLLVFRRAEAVS
ncbi:MAG TPA: hypothetical protein VFJ14_01735 [Nocardioidaceae bacterium]|nr:hypothetical protein [Nocardioidaceae bacterium]